MAAKKSFLTVTLLTATLLTMAAVSMFAAESKGDAKYDLKKVSEGDFDGDGKVTLTDVGICLKFALGIEKDTKITANLDNVSDMLKFALGIDNNIIIKIPVLNDDDTINSMEPTQTPTVTESPQPTESETPVVIRPQLVDTTNVEGIEYDEEVVKNINFVEVYELLLPTCNKINPGEVYALDANGLAFTTIEQKQEIIDYMKNECDADIIIAGTMEEIKSQPEMKYEEDESGTWWYMRGDWYSLEVESVKEDEIVVVKKRTGGPLDANYDRCVINKVDGKWTITSEKTILVS